MIKKTVIVFYMITSCACAQEVIYLNKDLMPSSKDSATYYSTAAKDETGYQFHYFNMDGTKYADKHYKSLKPPIREGQIIYYAQDGSVSQRSNYLNDQLDGLDIYYNNNHTTYLSVEYKKGRRYGWLKSYYDDGKLKRQEKWDNGNFVKGTVFTRSGQDTTFYMYEENAEFPGGMAALMSYLKKNAPYPVELKSKGIEGKVFLKFVIDEQGAISNVEVLRSPDPMLSEVAVAAVKNMPKWKPARLDGQPVKSYFNLPINFRIPD